MNPLNPGDFNKRCWTRGAVVDSAFDTTEDEVAEFGVLAFEDHVQVEARHLKEDWA